MKVWILKHHNYGYTDVWDGDTDPLEIPAVKEELSYLVGAYDEEIDEFKTTIKMGHGSIEERFSIKLTNVKSL